MQPSSSAPSQKPPTQPHLRQQHAEYAPSDSPEEDQQPLHVHRQSADRLSCSVHDQLVHAGDREIQPVSVTSPLQQPAASQSNDGWLAQTQHWAAAVWNEVKLKL